jgi:hypothetical protein
VPTLKEHKEEAFCRAYVIHKQAERAVIAAGYQCKTWKKDGSTSACVQANVLLKKPKVQQRIQELTEARARKADVSIEYVLTKLKTVVQRSLQEVRPVLDREGEPTGVYEYDSKGATGALKLIGEYLGMYSDKLLPQDKQGGDTYNTQVNFYIPDNNRTKVIANGHGSNGSESARSPVSTAEGPTRGAGKLCLPTNGAS